MNLLVHLLLLPWLAPIQTAPSGDAKLETVAPVVIQQFGPTFTVTTDQAGAVLAGDFDGDGIPDLLVVADSKDPIPDSYQFKYDLCDPYNTFFGFGNPSITASFGDADAQHNHDLLVIFGTGADGWRAATPKAKFVLINVPFDTVEIGHMFVKKNKPPIVVIKAREAAGMQESTVYWDGKEKEWKWRPDKQL